MPSRNALRWIPVLFALLSPALAFGRQAVDPSSNRSSAIQSAWSPDLGSLGLDQAAFGKNNLSRLSHEQALAIANQIWTHGYTNGYMNGTEAAALKCGPTGKNVDRTTVKLFLDVPDAVDTQITIALRSGLRALSDLRIVDSANDADATVAIRGFPNYLANSNRVIGYTVSYIGWRQCKASSLALDSILINALETATSIKELTDGFVSHIDSKVCEIIRQSNAGALKSASKSTP